MSVILNKDDRLCSRLRCNKIYTTHYGKRIISHTDKHVPPYLSYGEFPLVSNYFFEIRPLVLVASKLNFSHLIYFGHSYSFDGLLIDELTKKIRHVECTRAFDGKTAALRREHINTYGHAPAFNAPLTNEKSKVSGKRKIIYTSSKFIPDSKLILNLKNLIQKSLKKKLNKYDFKDGILIITFDITLPHLYPEIQSMLEELKCECHNQIKNSEFKDIIFVGISDFFYRIRL